MAKGISRRELLKVSGVAAISLLLGACAPKEAEPSTEVSTEPVESSGIAPVERATINFATPGAVGLERTMYENFLYKFMEENPDIKVEVSFESWADYMTKLPTIVAAGTVPEVIHNHWTLAMDYAYRGVFIDHMPYMERDGVDPDEFVPELMYEFAHEGKQYLLPKDSAINACYLNLSLFDEYDVPYPAMDWTIDDWFEMCQVMTRDGQGRPSTDPNFDPSDIKVFGSTFGDPTPAADFPAGFTNALGTHWFSEDLQTTHFDHEGVIEYWQKVVDLRCKLNSMPTPGQVVGQGDQWRNMQVCASTFGHHSTTFFAKQESVPFKFDVRPQPGGPFGQFACAACSGFGVTAESKNQEAGWKLLNFLTSEETQAWIGQQKRWGVQRKAIMNAIDPVDGIPEHFPDVHTKPFMEDYDGPLKKIGMKAPVGLGEIKTIYATEMEPLFICGGGDVAAAARRVKEQSDAVLAQFKW